MANELPRSKRIVIDDKYEEQINPINLKYLNKYKRDMEIRELSPKSIYNYERDLLQWFSYLAKEQFNASVIDVNEEDIIKKYKDSKIWLNSNEKDILDAMSDLHFWVWRYHTDNVEKDEDSKLKNKLIILDNIKTLSNLMDLDINEKKLFK